MSENTLENKQLIPEFTVNGKNYSLKSTRYLKVMYEKEVEKTKNSQTELTEEQSIKLVQYNNLMQDLAKISKKFESAKEEYWEEPTNKEKKAVYLELKEIYNEILEQIKNGKEQIELLNKATAQTLDIYEKMIIEALIEQHGLTKQAATSLWEDFVINVGKEIARDYVFAIGDELFNSSYEVEENSFLSQKQKKLQEIMKKSKEKNNK